MDAKTLQTAKELQSLATEGPYEWAIIPDGPDQMATVQKHFGFGDGDIHMIWLPAHPQSVVGSDIERPEHAVIFAMTGNGPNSKRNAQWLHFLLNCAADLLADSERAERLEVENKVLRDGLLAVEELIGDSYGVVGLHRNGDTAKWDELRTGGRYEDWLLAYDKAHLQEPTHAER